jgi:hypothetical protein
MNVINARYQAAVQHFVWPEQKGTTIPISNSDLDNLVNEVAQKIIAANQIKSIHPDLVKMKASLSDAFYLIVQDLDKKGEVVNKIENASEEQKNVLHHTFKKLSDLFPNVNSDDLKAATLLFGIQRIHVLVAAKNIAALQYCPDHLKTKEIVLAAVQQSGSVLQYAEEKLEPEKTSCQDWNTEQMSIIQEQETKLKELIEKRQKYDDRFLAQASEVDKAYLKNVDEMILKLTNSIAARKASLRESVAV